MYERQRNIFHHYDSFSFHNSPAARSLAKKVEPFLAGKVRQNLLLNTFFLQAPHKINNHWFVVTVHLLSQVFMPKIVKDKRSVCCTQLLSRMTPHLLVASWNHRISHAAPKSLDHAVSQQ